MRIALVDPSAYTPAYDHALAAALAAAGQEVELLTSRFAYAQVSAPAPASPAYTTRELFYRHARGRPGSRLRTATKLAGHVPGMVRLRRVTRSGRGADVVHFQWLAVPALDRALLPPRPKVLTAHDLLPREPKPGQLRAHRRILSAMDAVIVHSQYGRTQLLEQLDLPTERIHVIHHGAFAHLAELPRQPLPRELPDDGRPVVLFFGLLRPYKGVEVLLDAWPRRAEARLWIVGRPRMPLAPLLARAPDGVSFLPRYVSDGELAACFRRADLIVLPYTRTERFDQSGVLATALAFGKPVLASDIGGFGEIAATGAAELVPADDPTALNHALHDLLGEPGRRRKMAEAARSAARGPFSWAAAARSTLALYETLV